ncbi:hypothetical protein [Succinimonas amylolytica]|uniref:hypothetical protein n=1 Tax=Succinimonas amylolytica TaxID=83769 RepID=UPI0012F96904|nr:hypothetical protein [Succinimonas amylolytica]
MIDKLITVRVSAASLWGSNEMIQRGPELPFGSNNGVPPAGEIKITVLNSIDAVSDVKKRLPPVYKICRQIKIISIAVIPKGRFPSKAPYSPRLPSTYPHLSIMLSPEPLSSRTSPA